MSKCVSAGLIKTDAKYGMHSFALSLDDCHILCLCRSICPHVVDRLCANKCMHYDDLNEKKKKQKHI